MFRSLLALFALSSISLFAQVNFLTPANGAHGTSLPATCTVGDQFQLTSASGQQQWNLCTATNTWTAQGGAVGTAGGSLSGSYPNPTTVDINHTTVPTNSSADQTVVTTAPATGSWQSLPNCQDLSGNHLNYNTTTHAFTCGNTGGSVGSVGFNGITSGTNTSMSGVIGTGGSLTTSGTGVNDANRVNGAAPATSATVAATNSSGQIIAATYQGNGSKVQLSTGTTTANDCVKFDASGNTVDAGAACGTGGGGGATASIPNASISGATATFFSNCISSPCYASKGGNQVDVITATNTLTAPASGSGTVYVYWTTGGCAIGAPGGVSLTGTGTGPCAVASTTQTAFPNDATAIITSLPYAAGVWTAANNFQPTASNLPVITTGTGITQTLAPGSQQLSIDTSAASIGTGTANYVAKWNGNSYTLGTGLLQDNGTGVGVNCAASGTDMFSVCNNRASGTTSKLINTNAGGYLEYDLVGVSSGGVGMDGTGLIYTYNNGGSLNFSAKGVGGVVQFQTGSTVWMITPNDGGMQLTSGTQPTCDSAHRGTTFYVAGGTGVKDTYNVCAKDASDVYAWRTIY